MAGKHRKEKVVRVPSKHQLSKWERQKKVSRIIIICSAVFIVALIGLVVAGYYMEQLAPYQRTVIKVNDASFDMVYYIKALDAYTQSQDDDIVKQLTNVAETAIQQGALVREKAADLGISASDDEVSNGIKQLSMEDNLVTRDIVKAMVLSQKIVEDYCLPKQPASADTVEVQAMLLESNTMAADRKQKLLMGENFTLMASTLSVDPTTQSKGGYLGWLPKGYEDYAFKGSGDLAFKDIMYTMKPKEVSDPIFDKNMEKPFGYWVLEVIEIDQTKGRHAEGILCASKEQADEIRIRLVNGENFAELAKQYSQHTSKDSGGDLGWRVPGTTQGMLDRMIASLQPNTVSDVLRDDSVKTKGGYWIVQVLDNQPGRPLDKEIRDKLADKCFSDWLNDQAKNAKIENLMTQADKEWAAQRLINSRKK